MDFILNGQANGSVANILMAANFDVGALRPYIGEDGKSYLTMNEAGKPTPFVTNTPAALRYEEWKIMDDAVITAARSRLRLVADLRAAGLQYSIPNGLGKTVLETENMTDPGVAQISMDGLRKGNDAVHEFNLINLPLPIIHRDFHFSARKLAASRQGGSPIDVTGPEAAARRVAETAESLFAGTYGTYAFGGGTIYGLTNLAGRPTAELTDPASTGWTPATTVDEVLGMKQTSVDNLHYGPWKLYVGPSWGRYLDADYSALKGDITLRERLAKIEGITSVTTLDQLSGFDMVLVQQTSDVARAVVGMDITTLQWPSEGGMMLNFKVMAILVPQFRFDANGKTGIVHASLAT